MAAPIQKVTLRVLHSVTQIVHLLNLVKEKVVVGRIGLSHLNCEQRLLIKGGNRLLRGLRLSQQLNVLC